jgi:outer membrane receptor for ferrienterochelin and colicin
MYRLKKQFGYITINYAFYTAAGKETIEDYAVPDNEASLLAFANHRVNLNSCFNIGKKLSVSPTISFYGKRYGYTSIDTSYTSVVEELPATTLINLFVKFTPVKGIVIGVGVYDLLNQKFAFIQPYNGYHAPLPGPTREFIFRVQFDLNFKKKKEAKE